ncbi:MAG TPA: hypothetical protein VEB23_17285, partial [Ramlibacter sp.]|nr:hypothetical protein [Ramlibacter sp.]
AVDQAQARYNQEDAQFRKAQASHQQDLNAAVASGGGFGSGFDLFGLGKSKKEQKQESLPVRSQAHEDAQAALADAQRVLDDFNQALSPEFVRAQADVRAAQAGWQQADAALKLQEARHGPHGASGDPAALEREALAQVAAADVHAALVAHGDPLDPSVQAQAFMADPARHAQDWAWSVHAALTSDTYVVKSDEGLRKFVGDTQSLRPEFADPQAAAERERVVDAVWTRLRKEAEDRDLSGHRVVVGTYSYATRSQEFGSGRGNGLLYSLVDGEGKTVAVVDGLVAEGRQEADRYDSVDKFVDDNTLPGSDAALAVMDQGRARVEATDGTPRIAMRVLTGGAHEEETFERWTRQHPKLITGLTVGAAVVLSFTPALMAVGQSGGGRLASWMAGRHALALAGGVATSRSGTTALAAGAGSGGAALAGSSTAGRTIMAVQGTTLAALTAYGVAAFEHMYSQERARGQSISVDTAMQGVTVISSLAALTAMGSAYAHAGRSGTPGGARAAQVATWANRVAWTGFVPLAYDLHRLSTHNGGKGLRPGEQEQLWLSLAMDLLPELGGRAATQWVHARNPSTVSPTVPVVRVGPASGHGPGAAAQPVPVPAASGEARRPVVPESLSTDPNSSGPVAWPDPAPLPAGAPARHTIGPAAALHPVLLPGVVALQIGHPASRHEVGTPGPGDRTTRPVDTSRALRRFVQAAGLPAPAALQRHLQNVMAREGIDGAQRELADTRARFLH